MILYEIIFEDIGCFSSCIKASVDSTLYILKAIDAVENQSIFFFQILDYEHNSAEIFSGAAILTSALLLGTKAVPFVLGTTRRAGAGCLGRTACY